MLETVNTKYGKISGVKSNAGYSFFRGIPYAKAPIGDLRWKAPQDPDCWEEVRVCDHDGPACMQFDRWKDAVDDITDDSGHPYIKVRNYPYPPVMSEDCLYLNIYTPAESENDRLPVCFYIHGGGLQQWYGSDYEYCGDQFCSNGCIVVTITYRLNVFGFFAHPLLEDEHGSSGNYGLLDQIQALKWVYENIENFGGDRNRIMVFGQSAGGGSSLCCLLSPLSSKYVRRVSLQSSGGLSSLMPEASKQAIYEKGEKYMKECGCSCIEEMRKLPAEFLRDKNDELFGMFGGFGFNVDGYVLPDFSTNMLKDGRFRNVEMIVGCTADEGANEKKPMFGVNLCSNILALAKCQLINNRKPVYSYVFDVQQPGDDNAGVPHSCDNRYQFGSLDGSWRPYDEKDWQLSRKMTRYWANFAKKGDPNSDYAEMWLPYSEVNEKQMHFTKEKCEMADFTKENKNLEIESEQILKDLNKK